MIYQFKIWFEDNEEIIRNIEVKSSASFEDLHSAILDSIGFDKKHMASFYMCDENWVNGMEITQFDMTDTNSMDEEDVEFSLDNLKPIMSDSRLADFIKDPYQKISYVYDFMEMWSLRLQLSGIEEEVSGILYPRSHNAEGDAPEQYKGATRFKLLDDLEMDEIAEQIKKEYTGGTKTSDPYGDDDVDPDIMAEFNDLY